MTDPDDETLLRRLRDLALVELDVLLAGLAGDTQTAMLAAHAEELDLALAAAQRRAAELIRTVSVGDPLAALAAGPEARVRDGGREGAERVIRRLRGRATAARTLARLDDVAAAVYPRLVEVDRRRSGLGE